METLVRWAFRRSCDSSGHAGESNHRPHRGNRQILSSLQAPRLPSKTDPSCRTNRNREIRLHHGLPAEAKQRPDLQTAVCGFLRADDRESDAGYHHEQNGQEEEGRFWGAARETLGDIHRRRFYAAEGGVRRTTAHRTLEVGSIVVFNWLNLIKEIILYVSVYNITFFINCH